MAALRAAAAFPGPVVDVPARHPGFLRAAHAGVGRSAGEGRGRRRVLLRHRAAARDAVVPDRHASAQRRASAPDGRRGERRARRAALLRQPRRRARPRRSDGFRRPAARLPGGPRRRRGVLGRGSLLQHAARSGARRQPAARFGDLQRQRLAAGRPRARVPLAGHGAREGHPLRDAR